MSLKNLFVQECDYCDFRLAACILLSSRSVIFVVSYIHVASCCDMAFVLLEPLSELSSDSDCSLFTYKYLL